MSSFYRLLTAPSTGTYLRAYLKRRAKHSAGSCMAGSQPYMYNPNHMTPTHKHPVMCGYSGYGYGFKLGLHRSPTSHGAHIIVL